MGLKCLVSPVWQIWLFLLHMFDASLKGVPLPRSHPMAGGAGRIYAIAGTDATEKFMRQHGNPSMQVRFWCALMCIHRCAVVLGRSGGWGWHAHAGISQTAGICLSSSLLQWDLLQNYLIGELSSS